VYGILGPNGSGKSTTLGIILNVVNKTSGDFSWFDGKLSTHEALKKVGAIIERPNFYPYMTATQNLSLICKIKGTSTDKIDEKLKIVNLYERRNSKFSTYSLGMKQRLAIASALLADPELLILDEPTNGLDPQGIAEIRELIIKIAESGKTIILASHLLDEVQKVCTDFAVLRRGEKIFQGDVVSSLSGNEGVEIMAKDMKRLEHLVMDFPGFENLTINKFERMEVKFNSSDSSDDLIEKFHAYLIEKGIILTHLTTINKTLEKQFLELLSQN
jgi:ABC-2 type transport system ATP-binding protein